MAPLATVQASSDAWVAAGSQAEAALNAGYLNDQTINSSGGYTSNCGPSTASAFLSTGDQTSYYVAGRRLFVVHGGGNTYGEVLSAAYSTATAQTTVTITNITLGATALSTASITSVGLSPIWNSTGTGNFLRESVSKNASADFSQTLVGISQIALSTSVSAGTYLVDAGMTVNTTGAATYALATLDDTLATKASAYVGSVGGSTTSGATLHLSAIMASTGTLTMQLDLASGSTLMKALKDTPGAIASTGATYLRAVRIR